MKARHYNIHEAKRNLSQLIRQAEAGEEVVIDRRNKPVARVNAIGPKKTEDRPIGSGRDFVKEIADDFNEPLPDEVLEQFYK